MVFCIGGYSGLVEFDQVGVFEIADFWRNVLQILEQQQLRCVGSDGSL